MLISVAYKATSQFYYVGVKRYEVYYERMLGQTGFKTYVYKLSQTGNRIDKLGKVTISARPSIANGRTMLYKLLCG